MAKTISRREWNRYIERLRKLNDKAADSVREYMSKNGGALDIDRQDLIDYSYGVTTKYGEGAATLSAEMYDAVAAREGKKIKNAVPADVPKYSEVAKTINGILKRSHNEDMIASGVGRLVKRTSVDTVMKNALRDGAQWAWIPSGDTCPFCLMLASQGWVRASKKAIKKGHAEHIHANCDCTYAVRFDSDLEVEGYNPDEYREIYDRANGGSSEEKLKAMRRDYYAANKDKINAQKRAAYAERKEVDNPANLSIIKNNGLELFRNGDDKTIEPMPKSQFESIRNAFARQGGEIRTDEEAQRYLEWKDAEGMTLDAKLILLRKNPSRAAVFEELIHSAQYRNGEINEIPRDIYIAEVNAKRKLLKYADAYKLTDREIEETKRLLKIDEENLRMWEKKNGL